MSNIFDFPSERRDRPTADFLNDAVDLVRFDDLSRNAIADDVPESLSEPECRDWTNQELASIYRVRRLLEAAGVSTAVDRGLTDEGEPWCVFCRDDGEVFIHLCRLDGRYLLDSPNLARPLVGATFADLIDAFGNGALPTPGDVPDGSRVRLVRLHGGDNVVLHPVTMLAALVWTILLRSEDVVLLQIDPGEGLAEAGLLAASSRHDAAEEPVDDDTGALACPTGNEAVPDAAGRDLGAEQLAITEGAQGPRDALNKMFGVQTLTGVAAGLGTIAIACGFMSEALVDEDGLLTVSLFDEAAAPARTEREAADARAAGGDVPAMHVAAHDRASGIGDDVTDAVVEVEAAEPKEASDGTTEATVADLGLLPKALFAATPAMTSAAPADAPADAAEEGAAPQNAVFAGLGSERDVSEAAGDVELVRVVEVLSIADFKNLIPVEFRPVELGGHRLEASFDIASVDMTEIGMLDAALAVAYAADDDTGTGAGGPDDAAAAGDAAADAGRIISPATDLHAAAGTGAGQPAFDYTPRQTVPHWETGNAGLADGELPIFDDNARYFIDFLRSRSEDIEMLAWLDSVIVVDLGVTECPVYMQWELPEGGTVSTLVAQADYEAFGMLV